MEFRRKPLIGFALSVAIVIVAAAVGYLLSPTSDGKAEPVAVEPTAAATVGPSPFNGTMTAGRAGMTATLLPDGRILVAGGFTAPGVTTSSVEILSGSSAQVAAHMSVPRAEHSATLMSDGRVLVAGGIASGSGLPSVEIYDVTKDQWTSVSPMSGPRWLHTALRTVTGEVLVVGSTTTGSSAAELYDPVWNRWYPIANATMRFGAIAALLPDGRVLVAGGNDGGSALSSTDLIDPVKRIATAGPSMPTVHSQPMSAQLQDGRVFVTGGLESPSVLSRHSTIYDPSTGQWSAVADLPSGRMLGTASALATGNVVIVGGEDANGSLLGELTFDPSANAMTAWSTSNVMCELPSAVVVGGRLVVLGGFAGNVGNRTAVASYEEVAP